MPQHKAIPTPADQRRLERARERHEAAKVEYDAALAELRAATVTAMKNGASFREAAAAAGMSERTVHRWGKADGWRPPEEVEAERVERLERKAAEAQSECGQSYGPARADRPPQAVDLGSTPAAVAGCRTALSAPHMTAWR